MERDFELNGRNFKLNKIDVFKQFHIARRIAPILADLVPVIQSAQKHLKDEKSSDQNLDEFAKILAPIMNGLSKLSDEDANKVLLGLLSSIEIQQIAGNWAKVANDQMILMQDLELPTLFQIAGKAFAFNLAGFFSAAPQK